MNTKFKKGEKPPISILASPEGQQLLLSLSQSADTSIISEDLDGNITSWNHGAELMSGYTAEEVLGKPISVLIPPERQQEEAEIQKRILANEVVPHYESRRLCKDGRVIDVSVTFSPIRNEHGQIIGTSRIGKDITLERQTKEKLRLLSAALDAAANGVIVTDRGGKILWVNKAFEKLTGYPAEDVKGKTPKLLRSGRHDRSFYVSMWETILRGDIWRGDLINRRKDGSLYHEEMTITPLTNEAGAVTHFIAIKQDVTERVEAAKERERLIGELQAALAKVKTLSGLLPICATCKRVREDSGYWTQVEVYVQQHSEAHFSHGICPTCAKKFLEEAGIQKPKN